MEDKKTVADIVISRFLKDVDEKKVMPWQQPYERRYAINYFSKKAYHGFNRMILPSGEYLTKNQINAYNKEHGEDFRFQKGIEWWPVIFYKRDKVPCSVAEIVKFDPGYKGNGFSDKTNLIAATGWCSYWETPDGPVKVRSVLRYYSVAERKYFKNSKGETLPSRFETKEIVFSMQEPKAVIDRYIKSSGVKVDLENTGTPCYIPQFDLVRLNPYHKTEESWFAAAFHEFGHSTGHKKRLNRVGVVSDRTDRETVAVEECIAEICACLCCAETGITDFKTSQMAEYENNVSYVQSWKKRVQGWGTKFISIVHQADLAFNMICGDPDGDTELEA